MLFIPRAFHRIWLGHESVPAEFEEFGRSWLRHHPGWTMHTWTDDVLINALERDAIRRSSSLSGKANILRYEILFHFGGVYIDTDFECLRNIEPLLDDVYCFVGLQTTELANNAIMGAVPRHPFIKKLVDGIPSRLGRFAQQPSIKQSGPYYLTDQMRGRSDVTIFPPAVFYPYQWHERWRRHERFPAAYAVHHWSLSWRRNSGRAKAGFVMPKLSILLINISGDVRRLEWALEGLCAQIEPEFNTLVVDYSCAHAVRRVTNRYSDRLHISYVAARRGRDGRLAHAAQQRCMAACLAPRVLLLDGHCVPDKDVVSAHSRSDEHATVMLSGHRIYPPEKMYDFLPPVDYDAFKMHSIADPRCSVSVNGPSARHLDGFLCCCVSVPATAVTQNAQHLDRVLWQHAGWFIGEMSKRGHRVTAMPDNAFVTWLAS